MQADETGMAMYINVQFPPCIHQEAFWWLPLAANLFAVATRAASYTAVAVLMAGIWQGV